jgi:hypothetical protein
MMNRGGWQLRGEGKIPANVTVEQIPGTTPCRCLPA